MKSIIVRGTGRSGTSRFTRLLGLHPPVWSFRWESQLLAGIPGLADLVDVEPAAAVETRQHELVAALDLEARRHAARRFCEALFVPAARSKGASFWCEKTPRDLLFADTIAGILPDAKFLHVVRDGRDVASSIMARQFWPVASSPRYPATHGFRGAPTFEKVAHYWPTLIDIAHIQQGCIGAERWLDVRLEDLVAEPRATMETVLRFLQIPADDEFVQQVERRVRRSANTGRWRKDLTEAQILEIESIARSNLERYGYV